MKTLYVIMLFVVLFNEVFGENVRCSQKGGTTGECTDIIDGYMFSPKRNSCFAMKIRGCHSEGRFFDNSTDCNKCLS
uniref:Seminal fluid protein 24B7 n=1 Tax=Drosophila yakuba TaxID=7245 RepID=C4NAQ2_DROYA|nr:seminal fluid protein 24B7 [Drosophila yakuba]